MTFPGRNAESRCPATAVVSYWSGTGRFGSVQLGLCTVKNLFGFLVALLLLSAPPGAAQERSAAELLKSLQQKYDTVRDFSADFVHTYEGGVLRQQAVERGSVLIKKPGKMRWNYDSPEKKVFVSDGEKLYSYIPQDRQVIVSVVPEADEASTPALFLSGKGRLTRDFTAAIAELPESSPPGSVALLLSPRVQEPDYESLLLVVDERTLQIRRLTAVDRQGGRSTFAFSNLRENIGIPDREFVFRIPRGVDVITDSATRR
jgi:outer membrane lipoprotein carrier protein